MNKISCDVCLDLIPLVSDGVASEDSALAVKAHINECESCKTAFTVNTPPKTNTEKVFSKFKTKLRTIWIMLLMFGVFFGLSLTASENIFYNILLMPIIGALGYGLLRFKSLWVIPLLLYVTHFITNYLGFGEEVLDLVSVLWWSFYYCIFALLGILIAWLLHFALRREH